MSSLRRDGRPERTVSTEPPAATRAASCGNDGDGGARGVSTGQGQGSWGGPLVELRGHAAGALARLRPAAPLGAPPAHTRARVGGGEPAVFFLGCGSPAPWTWWCRRNATRMPGRRACRSGGKSTSGRRRVAAEAGASAARQLSRSSAAPPTPSPAPGLRGAMAEARPAWGHGGGAAPPLLPPPRMELPAPLIGEKGAEKLEQGAAELEGEGGPARRLPRGGSAPPARPSNLRPRGAPPAAHRPPQPRPAGKRARPMRAGGRRGGAER
ncbi:hypothetical protein PVAP13_5NG208281 [Panicum virgatum]|uniref:Uncharacterized protein n=1 Tax=Panicum virgatum TaxID=38727 RepID=A0A8T0RP88_PANVG|nr:hypothetical protein PVAP13_5NG208281 [Panicum virgatum]